MNTRSLRHTKWSFADCAKYIAAGRDPTIRKLANNTHLLAVPTELASLASKPPSVAHYAVRLHNTAVVRIYPDDSVKLFSGGFRTNTTKQRINSFSPLGVYQKNRTWYLSPDVEFYDGVRISKDGSIVCSACGKAPPQACAFCEACKAKGHLIP